MHTNECRIKELDKERRALENKGLKIGIGYVFYRKHGDLGRVKVLCYNDTHIKIEDDQDEHFVALDKFNSDNFRR